MCKKKQNTKTNEYHKPHALPELLQGNSIQFYNSEPSNVLFFLLSRKWGLWCSVCRCVYPGVCICLCIHSCLINLLLRFNSHWIIYMFQRRLNSEDFHGANTLNLRVGFDFLLLCKQFKAVKHTLELTNASPETCHVVTDVSACQPDRRYPFQPRTVYTYHLPQPIFFPRLWARHGFLPICNQTSIEMAHCESVFPNKTSPSGKRSQCPGHLIFPEGWGQL